MFSPSICHEVMGLEAMILFFCMLSFKPAFSLSSFSLITRLFSSISLSAIRVVSAYLRFKIFLPVILIPACVSSSPEFCMMYSVYKLNKQGDNIQSCHTPFPILNLPVVLCLILGVTSWPAYRFLRRQTRWSGIPISFKNISQSVVIHAVKSFSIVNEAEVEALLEFSCFFNDSMDVGNLISDSSALSKSSYCIWKFSFHVLLKPSLKDFEHYLASIWNERNSIVVWTFFGITLLWDWN